MRERRVKRSTDREEALQYLVESVADRAGARALVLVDDDGRIVAGMGMPDEVVALARASPAVARRSASAFHVDMATRGRDVTARAVPAPGRTLYFGALAERMVGLGDATRAVQRILA